MTSRERVDPIATGIPASGGNYTGVTRVVHTVPDLEFLEPGEILVVRASSPAWTVGMLQSGAIVAELGGPICHAAIIARELGIPSVVGVANATTLLATGARVTVNGTAGLVFAEPAEVK